MSRRYRRNISNWTTLASWVFAPFIRRITGEQWSPSKRDQTKKRHFLPSRVIRSHGLPSQSASKLPGWCLNFLFSSFDAVFIISTSSRSQIIWPMPINNDLPSPPQIRPLRPSAQQVEVFPRQCKAAPPRIWICWSLSIFLKFVFTLAPSRTRRKSVNSTIKGGSTTAT